MSQKNNVRVFLDSNVIFPAFCSPEEPASAILELFLKGELTIVVSQQVLDEVIQTTKEKLPDALPIFRKFFISSLPEIVKNPTSAEINIWAQNISLQNASILAAAVAARPDFLITTDQHFFENPEIVEKSKLRIVTPAQFLVLL
jgi:putative PIN family toxin of toxin-antitoxin system